MATLYYNNAINQNWNTVGNWWTNSGHSSAAGVIPANGDYVYVDGELASGPSTPVTLSGMNAGSLTSPSSINFGSNILVSGSMNLGGNNSYGSIKVLNTASFTGVTFNGVMICNSMSFHGGSRLAGIISGSVTFFDASYTITGIITGSAYFRNSSWFGYYGPNQSYGSLLIGTAEFHNSSTCAGTITGSVDMYDTSTIAPIYASPGGAITGSATFHNSSYNRSPYPIVGLATFNDSSYNKGTINGRAQFNYFSASSGEVIDQTGWSTGVVNGSIADNYSNPVTSIKFISTNLQSGAVSSITSSFHNSTYNNGVILTSAIFYDTSLNYSTVYGNATFKYLTSPSGGMVSDITEYANGFVYGSNYDSAGTLITNWVFDSTNLVGNCSAPATFNGSNINLGLCISQVSFRTSSYNQGTITSDTPAEFYDASFNDVSGYITNEAEFNDTALNLGTVNSFASFSYVTSVGGVATDFTGYANGIVGSGSCDGSGNIITVWSFDVNNSNTFTVTGLCSFVSSSVFSGSVTLNNGSQISFFDSSLNQGTITGNSEFFASSSNSGLLVGNSTFSDSTINSGTVIGLANFISSGSNQSGTILGTASFSPSAAGEQILNAFSGSYALLTVVGGSDIIGSGLL